MLELTERLAERNGFNFGHSKIFNKRHLSTREQEQLVIEIEQLEEPFLYDRHVHMIDFSRFGSEQPMHINLIRNPLSRFVSGYYYNWQPSRVLKGKANNSTQGITLDNCIKMNIPKCVNASQPGGMWTIVPYFCGQDDICRTPSTAAVSLAMRHVHMYFPVVGVLEMFDDFVQALEIVIPSYFEGAKKVYSQMKRNTKARKNKTKNPMKEHLSKSGSSKLKDLMKHEYDFYRFIRRRFYYLLIDIQPKIKY